MKYFPVAATDTKERQGTTTAREFFSVCIFWGLKGQTGVCVLPFPSVKFHLVLAQRDEFHPFYTAQLYLTTSVMLRELSLPGGNVGYVELKYLHARPGKDCFFVRE